MTRGRKRKHNPSIPAHIDQARLPQGIYWNCTGLGRWYVRVKDPDGPGFLTPKVAAPGAKLSDLHAIMEARKGGDRQGSLGYLMRMFAESTKFAALAPATRKDYEWCRGIVKVRCLSSGMTWDQLEADRVQPPSIQRLVEAIAKGGDGSKPAPAKANHVLRYLRGLFAWGIRYGHCKTNPAKGVQQATERGQIKMPTADAYPAILQYARVCGAMQPHSRGSCPPYLGPLMEISYLCRLRGIEVVTLTDAAATPAGVMSNRRKGSLDNVTAWTPRLRAAWDAAVALRSATLAKPQHRARPTPLRAEDRAIFVSEDGSPLTKSGLDSAWQAFIRRAIAAGVITAEQRFTLHGLKHRGITDSADKRSGGHKTEAMRQRYDHEVQVFQPAAGPEFSPSFSRGKEKGTSDRS